MREFLGREGTVLHLLHNHPQPGIPQMRATVEAPGGRSFIVMDGFDSTLEDAVRHRGRLTECEARAVIKQLAITVAHCHKHRIVLRDLRLDKVCVVDASQTKFVPPAAPCLSPPLVFLAFGPCVSFVDNSFAPILSFPFLIPTRTLPV